VLGITVDATGVAGRKWLES